MQKSVICTNTASDTECGDSSPQTVPRGGKAGEEEEEDDEEGEEEEVAGTTGGARDGRLRGEVCSAGADEHLRGEESS